MLLLLTVQLFLPASAALAVSNIPWHGPVGECSTLIDVVWGLSTDKLKGLSR